MKRVLKKMRKSPIEFISLLFFSVLLSFSAEAQDNRSAHLGEPIHLSELANSSQILQFGDVNLRMSVLECENEISTISFLVFEVENPGEQTEVNFNIELFKGKEKIEWMPSSLLQYALVVPAGHFDLWSCFSDQNLPVKHFIVREGAGDFMFDSFIIKDTSL
jgi:hypothetical protein